jgi:hypothetical protein
MRVRWLFLCALWLAACNSTPATMLPAASTAVPPVTLATEAPAPTLAPNAPELHLRVVPATVRLGQRLTMFGTGFKPGESVDFFFVKPDGAYSGVETVDANSNGDAIFAFDVPTDWQPGTWTAIAASTADNQHHTTVSLVVEANK